MTDVEFAERLNAHPAFQIAVAAIQICGRRLQEFFLKEFDDLRESAPSKLSPDQLDLYKSMDAEQRVVALQEIYNRQTDEGLTLAAAIAPLVEAARAGRKQLRQKKPKKSSSWSFSAQ
jgi:hypothetical protein